MREVNFSIPNVNKAAVGITTALYDRRALDCTSTLPLMNSLHNLAYLTTSSARIRDILTVDGGIERLVCILKEGKSRDMHEMWKWNLAFQCVVNIGVRGSENVRTRVVEADIVPVIATILDSYIKVIDKCRERAEAEAKRNSARLGAGVRLDWKHGSTDASDRSNRYARLLSLAEHRPSRRHPPPIDIPAFQQPSIHDPNAMEVISTAPQAILSSPPERTNFSRHHHHHHHHHRHHESQGRTASVSTAATHELINQPPATGVPTSTVSNPFGLRPVRDADRLPSMLPGLQAEVALLPETPTTPRGSAHGRPASPRASTTPSRSRSRPPIRHQLSLSGDSDDGQNDGAEETRGNGNDREPRINIMDASGPEDDVRAEPMLEDTEAPIPVAVPNASDNLDTEVFNIAGPGGMDGSIINAAVPPVAGHVGFSPVQPAANVTNPTTTTTALQWYTRLYRERMPSTTLLPSMPRDEDVLLSLQLLAYVSKYCNLRSYFQQSHLVPRLKIGSDIQLLDGEMPSKPTEEELEEYLQPDDFNIFPLVEKFTVRHHSEEMQYWAGVVMRNLCRKDDSRGGIRQCAYYQCGKWEEYTRQFAKCRRCRRTKYCSKECQKSAWVYHRHWCVAAQQ